MLCYKQPATAMAFQKRGHWHPQKLRDNSLHQPAWTCATKRNGSTQEAPQEIDGVTDAHGSANIERFAIVWRAHPVHRCSCVSYHAHATMTTAAQYCMYSFV